MYNYQEMITNIVDILCGDGKKGKSYLLVGDNSSGKSEILKKVVQKKRGESVYFIDSVNRTFDAGKVELESGFYKDVNLNPECVVAERIASNRFNLQDSFQAIGCIEQMYVKYQAGLTAMCKEFLDKEIKIVREKIEAGLVENKVLMDGIETSISSGYQAVIRLFMEILYFCDVMEAQGWESGFVVIDELDEYLSPKYSSRIFNYLQEQFPMMSFLVTTHSIDLVEASKKADLIILKETDYEIYSSEEMEQTVSAEDVFVNLFFEDRILHESGDDEVDEKLRKLLNLKIAGAWDKKAEDEFEKINTDEILPHQKMICRQIEEW